MKTLLAFLLLTSTCYAQQYVIGGAAAAAIPIDADEQTLADSLIARMQARQARVMQLQLQAQALEMANTQIRAYVCSRFCGTAAVGAAAVAVPVNPYTVPPTTPYGIQPEVYRTPYTTPILPGPASYGVNPLAMPVANQCGTPNVQVGVGLRYPW